VAGGPGPKLSFFLLSRPREAFPLRGGPPPRTFSPENFHDHFFPGLPSDPRQRHPNLSTSRTPPMIYVLFGGPRTSLFEESSASRPSAEVPSLSHLLGAHFLFFFFFFFFLRITVRVHFRFLPLFPPLIPPEVLSHRNDQLHLLEKPITAKSFALPANFVNPCPSPSQPEKCLKCTPRRRSVDISNPARSSFSAKLPHFPRVTDGIIASQRRLGPCFLVASILNTTSAYPAPETKFIFEDFPDPQTHWFHNLFPLHSKGFSY